VWALALLVAGPGPTAATAAPHGPHPRIALTPSVKAALASQVGQNGSAAHAVIEACRQANTARGASSGYQGADWATGASACALAWQLTHDHDAAARGVMLWHALLEDVATIGDGRACVPGASPKQARASIQRDDGYAIRFIGLHTALAYDWLHDAPGVDEALRRQSRSCFGAWIDWYSTEGYLHDTPGSNYQAGFVAAKTLIAIAESGEGGPPDDGARFFREVVDDLFGKQIVGDGLQPERGGTPPEGSGALVGGDWPEGWQYGALSVVEYALALRALEESGVSWPETRAWAGDLTVRFLYGLTPNRRGMYVGGDTETKGPYLPTDPAPLVATLIGPSSDQAAGWAAFLRKKVPFEREGSGLFDALADARAVTPSDPVGPGRPRWFRARGTGNVYVRSSWRDDAFWAVFTAGPHQVPDHKHLDASSFVFSRGGDALVVDPTPYASRSSLSSNALTVDSDAVLGDYKPSQTPWGAPALAWTRGTASGVVAARAELADAFHMNGKPSDVPLARRDWVFLPEGELVVVDRALTGGAGRKVYLRFRAPATLTLGGGAWPVARGRSGGSALAIHAVVVKPPTRPTVQAVPASEDCKVPFGACANARFDVGEYALKLNGPEVLAIHVVDGLGRDQPPAKVSGVSGRGIVGALVQRGLRTFVIASADPRAEPPPSLAYGVPGDAGARHVVLDAPTDAGGATFVTSTLGGDGHCRVTLSSSRGTRMASRPAVFRVAAASAGCAVGEEPDAPPAPAGGAAPAVTATSPGRGN
jgi:hypothetical protein